MSGSGSVRRRSGRKIDAQVSLFPFLAVLICTMGALIVLLVVLVQQARVQGEQIAGERRAAADQTNRVQEEARLEQENYDWRLEILQQQREEIARQLAGERLKLSHVEDHSRRLKSDLEALVAQAREMESLAQGGTQNTEAARAELARLQPAIEAARLAVEQAARQAEQTPQSFAIIPYEGPGGTRRRPIYIECFKDRVVLQPEGVTLTDRDFDGPLGPGNPLDAGLCRANIWRAPAASNATANRILSWSFVRKALCAYAAARAAIESWDDEFGYELIEDDVKLQYLPPDAALHDAMLAAVEEGRRRQEILRASQPNRYEGPLAAGFQATPHRGGFRAVGEGGEGGAGGGLGGGGGGGGIREGGSAGGGQGGEFETVMGGGGTGDAGEPFAEGDASGNAGSNGAGGAERRKRERQSRRFCRRKGRRNCRR